MNLFKKKEVPLIDKQIEDFVVTKKKYWKSEEIRSYLRAFVRATGVRSVREVTEEDILSFLTGVDDVARTSFQKLNAASAIRQFMFYYGRENSISRKLSTKAGLE